MINRKILLFLVAIFVYSNIGFSETDKTESFEQIHYQISKILLKSKITIDEIYACDKLIPQLVLTEPKQLALYQDQRLAKLQVYIKLIESANVMMGPLPNRDDCGTTNGIPPGSDKMVREQITDPKELAEWDLWQKKNIEKMRNANLQITLRRKSTLWRKLLREFINNNYTTSKGDIDEINNIIDQTILDEKKRAEMKLLIFMK